MRSKQGGMIQLGAAGAAMAMATGALGLVLYLYSDQRNYDTHAAAEATAKCEMARHDAVFAEERNAANFFAVRERERVLCDAADKAVAAAKASADETKGMKANVLKAFAQLFGAE